MLARGVISPAVLRPRCGRTVEPRPSPRPHYRGDARRDGLRPTAASWPHGKAGRGGCLFRCAVRTAPCRPPRAAGVWPRSPATPSPPWPASHPSATPSSCWIRSPTGSSAHGRRPRPGAWWRVGADDEGRPRRAQRPLSIAALPGDTIAVAEQGGRSSSSRPTVDTRARTRVAHPCQMFAPTSPTLADAGRGWPATARGAPPRRTHLHDGLPRAAAGGSIARCSVGRAWP